MMKTSRWLHLNKSFPAHERPLPQSTAWNARLDYHEKNSEATPQCLRVVVYSCFAILLTTCANTKDITSKKLVVIAKPLSHDEHFLDSQRYVFPLSFGHLRPVMRIFRLLHLKKSSTSARHHLHLVWHYHWLL
jgi:hypothetical protein